MKYIARMTDWNGNVSEHVIKKEWIDDIVKAVVGQYTFANNKEKFTIVGQQFQHVLVYVAESKKTQRGTIKKWKYL